jgi:hypothetical protein
VALRRDDIDLITGGSSLERYPRGVLPGLVSIEQFLDNLVSPEEVEVFLQRILEREQIPRVEVFSHPIPNEERIRVLKQLVI